MILVAPLFQDAQAFLLDLFRRGEELWLLAIRVLGIWHHVGWHTIRLLNLRLSFGFLNLLLLLLPGLLHSSVFIASNQTWSAEPSELLDLRTTHEASDTSVEATGSIISDLPLLLTELHGFDGV